MKSAERLSPQQFVAGRMTDLRHHRRSSALGLRLIALLVRLVIFTCWLVTARRLPKPMS